MQSLTVIGTSQRYGGTQALEAWHRWVQATGDAFGERVVVATCNRAELVLASPIQAPLLPDGYCFRGVAALEHLCRVATSLDSLNPGEDQIMSQVRLAFETAQKTGTTGALTSFAFQTALRIAKRVRREVPLAPAHTSLFSLARPAFEALLPVDAYVAILGAGEMGSLAARSLSQPGMHLSNMRLLIVNRTLEKAQRLADQVGGQAASLEDFLQGDFLVDGLVSAIPVDRLDASFFAKQPLKAVVDLGVPRSINPQLAASAGISLIGLEEMQVLGEERRSRLQSHLVQAESIIAEEIQAVLPLWAEREIGTAIAQMREHYRSTLEQTLEGLLEPAALNRLASKLALFPTKGLRGLARQHGSEAARVFVQEAGLGGSLE
jgi:glutamyl-tRNA reductase